IVTKRGSRTFGRIIGWALPLPVSVQPSGREGDRPHLNRSVGPASERPFGVVRPGWTPTALYSAVPCFHSPRHERTPGALPVEDLLPQDVCVPAVLGEFAQYVEVHPA